VDSMRFLKTIRAYGSQLVVCGIAVTGLLGGFQTVLGLSEPAEITLTILLVAATLWISEAIPLFATSFVILFLVMVWLQPALMIAGVVVPKDAFLTPFFSDIILLFLGGFVLSQALTRYQLDEHIAAWVLRLTGSRPSRALLGIMLATAVLSMWMSNTATTAMMISLATPLLAKTKESDAYRKAVYLGIAFSANLGGIGTPIGTPPNAIAMQAMAAAGMRLTFIDWMLLVLPVLAVTFLLLWWLLLRCFPPEVEMIQLDLTSNGPKQLHGRARWVIGIALLTVIGWLTSGLHPLSSGTVALIPVIAIFAFRLLDVSDFRRLSWDVLVLAGGGLCLGVAVQTSGLDQWIIEQLPLDKVGPTVLLVSLGLLTAVLTSVMSNTAAANLVIPVVMGLTGVSRGPLLLCVACACSMAMAMPVSTPSNSMVFAVGTLKVRDMVIPGLLISVLGLAVTFTLGVLWWGLLGWADGSWVE
jgi:solute carrier family 13 (sodium-dependent dicarboxylate transporter), member 2/3/5